MKTKEILKTLILMFIISILLTGTVCATNVEIKQDFTEDYKKWESLPENEKGNYIQPLPNPIKMDLKTNTNEGIDLALKETSIPEYYFLGADIELVVRNQEQTNSCWTFGSTNMISTNLQKLGLNKNFKLFSTRHMDYTTSLNFSDGINSKGYYRYVSDGGNYYMGLAYCTAGYGPVLEKEMPFENNENNILLSQIEGKNVAAKVEEYEIFPTIYKKIVDGNLVYYDGADYEYTADEINLIRKKIKQHILNYGAIGTTTYYAGETTYFGTAQEKPYYCYEDCLSNHAVTIVGWDDTYPKENFANQPQNDGAYIVLNSWGSNWGNAGYYYISYDDVNVEKMLFGVKESQNRLGYDNIYQYDELGTNTCLGVSANFACSANVFKTKTANEILEEIGIPTLVETDVEIYVNPYNSNKDIYSDDMIKVATKQNLLPGYHTIKIEQNIEIEGTEFVVTVKYSQGSSTTYIPVELNYYSNGAGSNFWDTATSEEGQTYLSLDGTSWTDIEKDEGFADTNACIKVFTTEKTIRCGDINKDYRINTNDLTYLGRYLNGKEGYPVYNETADVNEDGQIDWYDYNILKRYLAGTEGYETLPKPYSCGDMNRDYVINVNDVTYIGRNLNGREGYELITKIADVNQDGQIDWEDYKIIKRHVAGTEGYETLPKPYSVGDITRDYVINTNDLTYLGRHLNGREGYGVVTKIADINEDGQIDWEDYKVLKRYLAGTEGYETLPKPYEIGDVNRDYSVNTTDLTYLGRYLNGMEGYPIIEKLADTNDDGKIDWEDYKVLKKHLAGEEGYDVLPVEYVIYGDVNCDYKVNESDLEYLEEAIAEHDNSQGNTLTNLSKQCLKNADVNCDEIVNAADEISLRYYLNKSEGYETLPVILSEELLGICGDVFQDGKVNNLDSVYLRKYLENFNGYTLDEQGLKNADTNADGKVDEKDCDVLEQYIVGNYETLPHKNI